MKIILTGATGFVGGEALYQVIDDPDLTLVTCIARRELDMKSPKLKTVILEDFTRYDSDLAQNLSEHDGCIWTLGGKASDLGSTEFEKVTTTFTLSFAKAIAIQITRRFRLVYLSGMGADPTERAIFPWEKLTRHMKGRTERLLQQEAKTHQLFCATAFRPGGIFHKDIKSLAYTLLSPIGIRVGTLCQAMIKEIKRNPENRYRVLSNSEIKMSANW